MSSFGYDPFQVFEVEHQPCMLFYIKIIRGHSITKGSAIKDRIDTPDPYVTMSIKTSPHGVQRTSVKDNDVSPVWDETFKFYLNPHADNELVITLMDANYIFDERLCTQNIPLKGLPLLGNTLKQTIDFNQTSKVDVEMWAEHDNNPELRYSLTLCEEEKLFIEKRKQYALEAMQKLLGPEDGPETVHEVPTIGVLGSGGGFRAMTAFSGVMSALVESKILEMVTYNVGLSGSAWYLSTLYSHPDWPQKSPKELRQELRDNISNHPFWLINPRSIGRYMGRIMEKRKQGQPISFTDLFGHLVGETLLKGRLDSKLTNQQAKLKNGEIPMPMYSCLHVKKHVSAMVFHEWMEFSPYEIGMPKYGTFMKPELFGSKFFIGHLIKKYEEPPLHFLQGIWGSAFCIQFKRLLHDDKKSVQPVDIEEERNECDLALAEDITSQENESSDTSDSESDNNEQSRKQKPNYKSGNLGKKDSTKEKPNDSYWTSILGSLFETHPLLKTIDGRAATVHNFMRGLSLYKAYPFSPFTSVDNCDTRPDDDKLGASSYFSKRLAIKSPLQKDALNEIENVDIPQCNSTKPSEVRHPHDAQRRRSVFTSSSTKSPKNTGVDHFDGIFEMYPTSIKKLYVVDGGLSFNSPYPLLLRPQRAVDLILSFDFSARASDTTPPFKELKLAMQWARLNNVPFPDIDENIVNREGIKECYVFSNPSDPRCPIVMHFVLVNITFRDEKRPGVKRRTKEEKDFADFDIFDDPTRPYSTFNFKYTNQAFDRLSELTEFNTLLCKDLIIDNIKKCVQRLKIYSALKRAPIKLQDIKKLKLKKTKEAQLKHFLESFDDGGSDSGDVSIQ